MSLYLALVLFATHAAPTCTDNLCDVGRPCFCNDTARTHYCFPTKQQCEAAAACVKKDRKHPKRCAEKVTKKGG